MLRKKCLQFVRKIQIYLLLSDRNTLALASGRVVAVLVGPGQRGDEALDELQQGPGNDHIVVQSDCV